MISLGLHRYLPDYLANNPFHPPLVKFSRLKTGSSEILFLIESKLLQFSGIGLLVMFILVLPDLEKIDILSSVIRLSTLVYPCFFIWSLTRVSGVELMQVLLEGRWTAELLSSPLANRHFTDGFITPVWMVVRQYLLITIFSLLLYTLERHVLIPPNDRGGHNDLIGYGYLYCILFINTISCIVFVYLARLFTEIRFRNSLIKGLITMFLFIGGGTLVTVYLTLLIWKPHMIMDFNGLFLISTITIFLITGCGLIHVHLSRYFRHYLTGQLDIDMIIFDKLDPRVSDWTGFTHRVNSLDRR